MKICMVVEDIYPLIKYGESADLVNGRALHLRNLAEALCDHGHEISFVTMDYGQGIEETLNGFKIYRCYGPEEGGPGLRFFTIKAPGISKAMINSNADIYMFMCAEGLAGIVAGNCKKMKRRFIFYGGHDKDFELNGWNMNMRDRYLFKKALADADIILCQNTYPMKKDKLSYRADGVILWIANYSRVKRPELFVELAKQIDDDFVMIGGRQPGMSEKEYKEINASARSNNVNVMGALSLKEAEEYISRAKVLVNTSESEGLSNTFLQAWRKGIPVVSFVDPDGMIQKNSLGEVVSDMESLEKAVETLKNGITPEHSAAIKTFFDNTFSGEIIAERFNDIIKEYGFMP
jgi:glycosyltransferase involved in cell wall biosynthesis